MNPVRVYDPDSTPLRGTVLLEASAGTGKTYALERMVARLVSEGTDPLDIRSILVVTYTNRAAREMKERIRILLTDRSRELQRGEKERELCSAALSDFDRAPIYTIHGFCQMVLSTWPFESDSPFVQELIPGGELELSQARSWMAGLDSDDVDGLLLQAAWNKAGSVEGIAEKIAAELTDDGIPPGSRVLPEPADLNTFTGFIRTSAQSDSSLSLAVDRLLSREWSSEGMNGLFKASGMKRGKAEKSLGLIRAHMAACRPFLGILELSDALFGDPGQVKIGRHFLDLFRAGILCSRGASENPDMLEDLTEAAELADILENLFHEMEPYVGLSEASGAPMESLVGEYQWRAFMDIACSEVKVRVEARKDTDGRWGYADLISRVAQALSGASSALENLLRSRFGAALIDEFQDTDPRQWSLFHKLFGSKNHLLVLIGDPKQSIYGFRGTGLQAYNTARDSVSENSIYRLDTNYRSIPALVGAVNRLFSPIFREGCSGNPPVGFESVGSGKKTELIYRGLEDAAPITVLEAPHLPSVEGGINTSAAGVVVKEIRRLLDPSSGIVLEDDNGGKRALPASDIAVLVRNSSQEDAVLDILGQSGIPAIRIRSSSVFSRPVAALLRSFLEALERPGDARRWKTLLLGDFFKLPFSLIQRFEEEGRLDEYVERSGEWKETLLAGRIGGALDSFFCFSTILSQWAAAAGRFDVAVVLERPWPQRLLAGTEGERHWQDWNQLLDLTRKKQSEGLREPADLIHWIDTSSGSSDSEGHDDAIRLETESPAVRVMTMHASKGLEFPLVFLLGGLSAKSSRRRSNDYRFDDAGLLTVDRLCRDSNWHAHCAYEWEEVKRLWYVSCTRASRALWVVLPHDGPFTQIESILASATGLVSGKDLPPHEVLDKAGGESLRISLNSTLEEWSSETSPMISLSTGDTVVRPPLPPPPLPTLSLAALPSSPVDKRDPVTSSYTSLTRHENHGRMTSGGDERDVDRHTDTGESDIVLPFPDLPVSQEDLPLASDRGALFGTLVHTLFEECDFRKAGSDEAIWLADEQTETLFRALSGRYFHPDWYAPRAVSLKRLVRSVLRSPLPEIGPLCSISTSHMKAEVEFLMSVPCSSRIDIGENRLVMPGGYLKGFIDLLIRHEDRWWVLDWKTNVPPGALSAESYDGETVGTLMDSNHYHLQYELYLLSLCRSLSANLKRPVDWDSEIGGALYLFVRGMREDDSRGVFFRKPDRSRLMELASAAGLDGVII